jgi:Na+/proline symporter
MPLYYKMNLVSIYEYLLDRFGNVSYKTGAAFFILSRTLGSAIRLYLATFVLHLFLFEDLGVPYFVTALTTVLLIWVYTFKGGVKTIVYTDAFQTIFLISAVALCVVVIANSLDVNVFGLFDKITATKTAAGNSMTKIFFFDDGNSPLFFPKQFIGGMFLAITMTGLDQDLMQKNLTCKSLKDAQKNMYSFTAILVFVNFLFLLLGGAMYVFANKNGITLPVKTDDVFPTLALGKFGTLAGVFFLLGITASSYASADSALTALTTGFCIDFLNFAKRDEKQKKRYQLFTHILKLASLTYGPLLGLFSFGIFTKRKPLEKFVPIICFLSPLICYFISLNSAEWFNGYLFGNELLILNGILTFIGLWFVSKKAQK